VAGYRLTVSYDGSGYSGWQVQPNGKTIQCEIERRLRIILKENIKITGAGRTDAGVHAFAQVAHFDFDGDIDLYKFRRSMNGLLPGDIRVMSVEKAAPGFHARKSAVKKEYIYLVSDEDVISPLLRGRVYFCFRKLDIDYMKDAAARLEGEHDFKAFQAYDCNSKTSVRTIFNISINRKEYFNFPVVEMSFTGSGFLKHMVRNIVGTLIDVGSEKITVNKFIDIFNSHDRINAGLTAPSRGLYLKEVFYGEGNAI